MKIVIRLMLVSAVILSSCSYKNYYPMEIDMDIMNVTALNLEEDDYWLSTGQDEIELHYTLGALNENNQLVGRLQRMHYRDLEFSRRGESKSGFNALAVKVPAKGKVYFSIHLIENDDYFSMRETIDNAKTVVDIAEFVSRNKRNGQMAARSLRMASKTLNWLGILVTVVDILDTNDQLLGICAVLDNEDLQKIASRRKLSGEFRGAGSNWGDRYDYRLDLSLFAKQIFGRSVKERIKAKAPNVLFNIAPIAADQNLNMYWNKTPDRLLESSEGSSSDYVWSDGLWNKSYAASFGFGITPAFNIGNTAYGKFYLQAGYRQFSYQLDFDNDITLGNQYLAIPIGVDPVVSIRNIALELQQYSAAALFKIFTGKMVWDFGGGVLHAQGRTAFNEISFDHPGVSFIYDEKLNVLEKDLIPFVNTKIGFGKIKRNSGFMLSAGILAYQPNYRSNDNYGITVDKGNRNFESAAINSSDFKFNLLFGLDIYF